MSEPGRPKREPTSLALEEAELASRALHGDREAFDCLFDRYFIRLAWHFRHLVAAEARIAIEDTLRQMFASMDDEEEKPLAERALRFARARRPSVRARRYDSSATAPRPRRVHP